MSKIGDKWQGRHWWWRGGWKFWSWEPALVGPVCSEVKTCCHKYTSDNHESAHSCVNWDSDKWTTSHHHHHTGATTNNVLVVNSKSWPPEWMVDAKWCGCRWSWSLKRVKWSIVKSAGEVISGDLNGLERLITAYCACFLLAELRRHLDWNTHQTTACSN